MTMTILKDREQIIHYAGVQWGLRSSESYYRYDSKTGAGTSSPVPDLVICVPFLL